MINQTANYTSGVVELLSTSTAVPQDFLGFHFHRYPTDYNNSGLGASPTPEFSFGACRTVDNDGQGYWRIQNPSNGVYNWGGLDTLINAMPGKSIVYTLSGTPAWCVSPTDQTKLGPWNHLGECGMPTNMTYVTTFLSALFTKYAGKIKYFEIWNEPAFTQNYTGFWWGSMQDMLLLAKTCYEWIKANQPNVIVISPGFTDWNKQKLVNTIAYQYLNTTLASTGKKGHEYCDVIAFHPYTLLYSNVANSRGWATTSADLRNNFLESMLSINTALGTTKPLIISEFGLDGAVNGGQIPTFYTLSGKEQAILLWRTLAYSALRGIKGFYIYGYDDTLCGAWCSYNGVTKTPELIQMANDFHNNICGKTIAAAQRYSDGRLSLTMSDGKIYCY